MAPKRETFLSFPLQRRCLAAGAVLLGVLLCAEHARPARAQPDADARELRGAQLEELKRLIPDLDDDDAEVREAAQQAIYALGFSFRDEVAVCLAGAKRLEARARLMQVLDRWRQDDFELDFFNIQTTKMDEAGLMNHLRTCPVCSKFLPSSSTSSGLGTMSPTSSGGTCGSIGYFGTGSEPECPEARKR